MAHPAFPFNSDASSEALMEIIKKNPAPDLQKLDF